MELPVQKWIGLFMQSYNGAVSAKEDYLCRVYNTYLNVYCCEQGHKELFPDEALAPFLEGVTITTDEQRVQAVSTCYIRQQAF